MSRFDDRVTEHPVGVTLGSLRDAFEQLSDETIRQLDEAHPDTHERAIAAIDHIEGLLESADPRLVPQGTLDAIHGHCDQALQAISNIATDPQASGANLDQAIEAIVNAAPALAAASAGFTRAAQKIGRRSGGFHRKLRRLEGDAESIGAELRDLEAKTGSDLNELSADQQQRRQELTRQLEELRTAIEAERQRTGSLANDFEQRFTRDEGAREATFGQLVEELKGQSAKTASDLEEQAENARQALADRGERSLAEVETIREKVSELWSIITDTATAGAFHDEAEQERETADRWRNTAVGFGIGALVIAVIAVILAATTELSPAVILAKIAATTTCGAIAIYAGGQSAHHRRRGDQAKDLELELVTADGFLNDLDESEQRGLRKDYFARAFRGRENGAAATAAELTSFGLTPELISLLVAVFKAGQQPSSS